MRRELLTLLLLLAPLTLGASEPQAVNRPPLPAQVVDGKPRASISTPKNLPAAGSSQPVEWAAIQPVKAISGIDGELRIKAGGFFVLRPNGTADGKGVVWFVHPKPARKEVFKTKLLDGTIVPIFVFSGSESEYAVTMVVVAGEDTTQFEATAIVEGVVPPVPPVPPIPPVPPVPPTPVDPSPFPDAGLRVLIVYETSEQGKYPPGQMSAIYSKVVRDYLDSKCVKVAGDSEYRIYDRNVDANKESKVWQDAMAKFKRDNQILDLNGKPKAVTPWLYVGNGKTGYDGPLPATADELLSIVKKYAE